LKEEEAFEHQKILPQSPERAECFVQKWFTAFSQLRLGCTAKHLNGPDGKRSVAVALVHVEAQHEEHE